MSSRRRGAWVHPSVGPGAAVCASIAYPAGRFGDTIYEKAASGLGDEQVLRGGPPGRLSTLDARFPVESRCRGTDPLDSTRRVPGHGPGIDPIGGTSRAAADLFVDMAGQAEDSKPFVSEVLELLMRID